MGNGATEVPLLARLPRVEFAKLLNELQELEFPAGAIILEPAALNDWLYLVIQGQLAVLCTNEGKEIPLVVLGAGEMFGELNIFINNKNAHLVKALQPTRLCRLPGARLRRLLQIEPKLAEDFIQLLVGRVGDTLHELSRAKVILASYMEALWGEIPLPQMEEASSKELAPTSPVEQVAVAGSAPSTAGRVLAYRSWLAHPLVRSVEMVLGIVGAFMVYWLNDADFKTSAVVAILLWATYNWLLGAMPDYAVGLVAAGLLVVTHAVTPPVAFSGFANPAWFLLLGAGGMGVAVSRSGLLYRLALHMLRLLPPTYVGQSLAMAFTGILFTPLLPSVNSRMLMASPLARELSEAMRFPERGKGSAGLAMSTFLGFGLVYFIFLNGANTSLLAWSLLPENVQRQISWTAWLWTALPLGALVFVLCYMAILYLYPPEPTAGVSRQTIKAQLQVLGPMSRMERIISLVLGAVLAGFLTQTMHGIDPAWVALAGFVALIAFGVIDKNGIKGIDWNFLLLFGVLISVSEITKVTGLSAQLSGWIEPVLQPFAASPYFFLAAVGILTLVMRLVVPLQPTVLMMTISLLPFSIQLGYNPITVALVILALSNNWIVPQQNSMYLTVYSGTEERAFSHRQVRPLAVAYSVITLVAVLVSVPFWQFLGLIPG